MKLYVVATPIGNYDDMSRRAIDVLSTVDLIAAEDTRHSGKLLQHFGIKTPMQAYHDFNETGASTQLVEKIKSGASVALVSDAGTPLISDPGYRLVKLAREAEIEVVPIPGPSALVTALSVSGLATDRFLFVGFLPAKKNARLKDLQALTSESATLVFYESRHRIGAMLEDLIEVFGEDRQGTIARELTKTFEQVVQGSLAELGAGLATGDIVSKGEFVVVVAGQQDLKSEFEEEALMSALLEELPPKKAAAIAHKLTGTSKKLLYDIALKLKKH